MYLELDQLARVVEKRAPSRKALDRLNSAVLVAEELRARGDELLDRFVAQARQDGCSWTEIGATLGVSRQAAHQRFLAADQSPGGWPPHATDIVRAAMVTAQADARRLGHNYLGTEHALLGLLDQAGGAAARALAMLDIDRADVLARATLVIGVGADRPSGSLAIVPRLKRALELARAHARALGQRCFDTEHLLLGIVDIDDSVAAVVLRELGAPPEVVRAQLAAVLGVDPRQLRRRSRRRRLRRTPTC